MFPTNQPMNQPIMQPLFDANMKAIAGSIMPEDIVDIQIYHTYTVYTTVDGLKCYASKGDL
jgi:hypothetical protein